MKRTIIFLLCLAGHQLMFGQQSTLRLASFYSVQLHHNINYYVLLPPGYDGATERYPVIYMLRGAEWEWITPTQDGSRRGRDLKSIVDGLYAQGKIGKMIYVMPGLSQPGTDEEYTVVAYQMFPYIDSVYRTIPTRWHRGVDGFSYGGLGEMNIVSTRPDAFATAASYDGSFWAFDFNRIMYATDEQARMLDGIRFMHHSGANLPGVTNYESVRQLVDLMASRGWENEFSEIVLEPGAVHNWWYADEHMLVTLPLHWETFSHPPQSIQAQLLAPLPGARTAGMLNVEWSIANSPASSRAILEYSPDRGKSWNALFTGPVSGTSFAWNTAGVPDGAWYLLRLSVVSDTAYGRTELSAPFTIDNPGNGAPSVEILSLASGDSVTGLTPVQWSASDPEGDSLTFSLDLSVDGGYSWEPIASGLAGTEQYLWDSRISPNSTAASLRIRCSDGQLAAEALTGGLRVLNDRASVAASSVQHMAGMGDGSVIPRVVDPAKVVQHKYQVSFKDSAGRAARFSVRDLDTDSSVVADALIPGAGNESQEFHGLRLEIVQPEQPTYSQDSSRWLTGQSTLTPQVTLPQFSIGSTTVKGVPWPADYLVTVYDHVVDTSSSYLDATPVPMRFTVRNLTKERNVAVVFSDLDGNEQISPYDEVIILEPGVNPADLVVTWDLAFTSIANPVLPQAGDAFLLRILKPFTSKDTLQFTPTVTGIVEAAQPLRPEYFALYQNYPNPFNPSTTIRYSLPARSRVRLTVFNVLGQEMAELVNGELEAGYHEVKFDGARLASGMYFYRLRAGEFTSVKKLLLVR